MSPEFVISAFDIWTISEENSVQTLDQNVVGEIQPLQCKNVLEQAIECGSFDVLCVGEKACKSIEDSGGQWWTAGCLSLILGLRFVHCPFFCCPYYPYNKKD